MLKKIFFHMYHIILYLSIFFMFTEHLIYKWLCQIMVFVLYFLSSFHLVDSKKLWHIGWIRMGSHVFMSGKVFRTITEFFFSYIFVFLGYSITFHIALHDQGGNYLFTLELLLLLCIFLFLCFAFFYTGTHLPLT